ncbi:YgaB family protein [Streptococcus uberis]
MAVKRKQLADIQDMFQKQTEQVIRSYRSSEKPSSFV